MKNSPSIDELARKIREIFTESLAARGEIEIDKPLMKEHGFDSLDMIEAGFALEEFFGFEFSGRNAIEELDSRIGDQRIMSEGVLTEEGRQALLERMPELAQVDLPPTLRASDVPQYFTVSTYARLIKDFYDQTPDVCPETGEPVLRDGFRVVSAASKRPVPSPTGDEILDAWLDAKAREIGAPEAS